MENNFVVNKLKNDNNLIFFHNQADIYNNKGLDFFQNNDFENAVICFFQALTHDKNYAHAYSNIGNILIQKGEFEEAISMYQKAINIDNQNSLYHFNLGIAYSNVNNNKASAKEYKRSLKLDPSNLKAYKFLGNCYIKLKDFKKAIDTYRKWSELDPQNPEPNFILGQIHVRNGRFNLGWKLYEYGLKNNIRKPLSGFYQEKKEIWDGKPFNGSLLVYGEQGLGDQINFGTLLFELLEIQKNVCVKVNKKLVDLFTCSFPTMSVFSEEEEIPQNVYDKYIALGSLNKFLKKHSFSEIDTISKDTADRYAKKFGLSYKILKIKNYHVDEIFRITGKINFLNIDIEGLDKEVLLNCNLKIADPEIVVFEDNSNLLDVDPELEEFLKENNYFRLFVTRYSKGFAKK